MIFWLILLLSVIFNAFYLGFRYASYIQNKLEMPIQGKQHLYCLGDEFTYGYGVLSHRKAYAWPYLLNVSLGAKWQVINYGIPGATVRRSGKNAITEQRAFKAMLESTPSHILLMLGTNDSKLGVFSSLRFEDEFSSLLSALSESCKTLILLLPSAVICENPKEIRPKLISEIVDTERSVAEKHGIPVIDLYSLTRTHPEWYTDAGYLNRPGNQKFADYLAHQLSPLLQGD